MMTASGAHHATSSIRVELSKLAKTPGGKAQPYPPEDHTARDSLNPQRKKEATVPVKPTTNEEEYFARQEVERRRKVAAERQAKLLAEELEREREIHFMKCPKCGMQLEEIAVGDVRVDKCFSCEGIWLDQGELEVIRQKEGGFMGRLLNVFH